MAYSFRSILYTKRYNFRQVQSAYEKFNLTQENDFVIRKDKKKIGRRRENAGYQHFFFFFPFPNYKCFKSLLWGLLGEGLKMKTKEETLYICAYIATSIKMKFIHSER